jgi:hypothetical protein
MSAIPFRPRKYLTLLPVIAFLLAATVSATAQNRGATPAGGPAGNREANRTADEFDREINRLRNNARLATERRRNMFPQINEDFQRIQVIHNELVRMMQAEKGLDYARLITLSTELKKRGNRLRTSLVLPESEKREDQETLPVEDASIKKSVVALHELVVNFVTNPIFKNLGVVDAKMVSQASDNLRDIIQVGEDIKKTAEALIKTAKKI